MWLMPWAVHAQPLTLDHQGRGLFSPVLEGAVHPRLTVSLDVTTVRRRVATIDFERLQRARESISQSRRPTVHSESSSHLPARRPASPASDTTLSLNLFEDVELTGIVESTEPTFSGGYSMSGHLGWRVARHLDLRRKRRDGGWRRADARWNVPNPLGRRRLVHHQRGGGTASGARSPGSVAGSESQRNPSPADGCLARKPAPD